MIPTGPTALLHLLIGYPVATICCALLVTGWWMLPEKGWTELTCCQSQEDTRTLSYCTVPGGPFDWVFLEDAACWSLMPVDQKH